MAYSSKVNGMLGTTIFSLFLFNSSFFIQTWKIFFHLVNVNMKLCMYEYRFSMHSWFGIPSSKASKWHTHFEQAQKKCSSMHFIQIHTWRFTFDICTIRMQSIIMHDARSDAIDIFPERKKQKMEENESNAKRPQTKFVGNSIRINHLLTSKQQIALQLNRI